MINVLFDIDETLLSVPDGFNAKTSSVMFKKIFNIDANEDLIDTVGKVEKGIIREVLEKVGYKTAPEHKSYPVEIPDEAYIIWAKAMGQELAKQPARVLPGIPEFLTALSKNPSVKLGLLTGNSPYRADEKLKSAGLDNFFRNPETGKLNGVFGNMADKRDDLFEIAKQQEAANDKFIIIDDSLLGAQMAKKHNIPSIMVTTGKSTQEQLSPLTPYVFPNFGENRWQQAIALIEKL